MVTKTLPSVRFFLYNKLLSLRADVSCLIAPLVDSADDVFGDSAEVCTSFLRVFNTPWNVASICSELMCFCVLLASYDQSAPRAIRDER